MIDALARGVVAFGRFWWNFLVGDTPELFLAMLVLVGVAFALRHDRIAAVILLPVLAIAFLLASAYRGRARRSRPDPPADGGCLTRPDPPADG